MSPTMRMAVHHAGTDVRAAPAMVFAIVVEANFLAA
jgi:hypothetical protein